MSAQLINMKLDDVQVLTEGDSNYQREHALGTVVYTDNDYRRTIMADYCEPETGKCYKKETQKMGDYHYDTDSSGATIEMSNCTQLALKESSNHTANN